MKLIDLTGQRFAKLLVVKRHNQKRKSVFWECLCDCKKTTTVLGDHLRSGHTQSCGCLRVEVGKQRGIASKKHGKVESRIYAIWSTMKQRCLNSKQVKYKHYGGRGIKVCSAWLKFENFYNDMGDPPTGMTLGREDNNGDYTLSNCKWESLLDQANNKRNSKFITYCKQTLTRTQWSRRLGGSANMVKNRIELGWTEKEAISTPKGKRR